ncbi:hypothetical protein [Sinomonas terrae]|uniref:hypothetical protein n=1 Tax=Sinomonas terrae TaxID=2908838 RepID=UPI0035590203
MAIDYDGLRPDLNESPGDSLEAVKSANAPVRGASSATSTGTTAARARPYREGRSSQAS